MCWCDGGEADSQTPLVLGRAREVIMGSASQCSKVADPPPPPIPCEWALRARESPLACVGLMHASELATPTLSRVQR